MFSGTVSAKIPLILCFLNCRLKGNRLKILLNFRPKNETHKQMCMSRNGFIIHFVISLKADRPYKATMVYNLATVVCTDIPWQTVVYPHRAYDNGQSSDTFRPTLAFDRP